MKIVIKKVSELKEHPDNKKYFNEIKGEFWLRFLEDIKEVGIKSPLTIDENNVVIKGNQRLKACQELDIKEIPCIVQEYESEDDKVEDLIRDNLLRRELNIFDVAKLVPMFKLMIKSRQGKHINKLNKKDEEETTSLEKQEKLPPSDQIRKLLGGVTTNFMSFANIFNDLPDELQELTKKWALEKEDFPTLLESRKKIDELKEIVEGNEKQLETIESIHKKELEEFQKKYQSQQQKSKEFIDQQHKERNEIFERQQKEIDHINDLHEKKINFININQDKKIKALKIEYEGEYEEEKENLFNQIETIEIDLKNQIEKIKSEELKTKEKEKEICKLKKEKEEKLNELNIKIKKIEKKKNK